MKATIALFARAVCCSVLALLIHTAHAQTWSGYSGLSITITGQPTITGSLTPGASGILTLTVPCQWSGFTNAGNYTYDYYPLGSSLGGTWSPSNPTSLTSTSNLDAAAQKNAGTMPGSGSFQVQLSFPSTWSAGTFTWTGNLSNNYTGTPSNMTGSPTLFGFTLTLSSGGSATATTYGFTPSTTSSYGKINYTQTNSSSGTAYYGVAQSTSNGTSGFTGRVYELTPVSPGGNCTINFFVKSTDTDYYALVQVANPSLCSPGATSSAYNGDGSYTFNGGYVTTTLANLSILSTWTRGSNAPGSAAPTSVGWTGVSAGPGAGFSTVEFDGGPGLEGPGNTIATTATTSSSSTNTSSGSGTTGPGGSTNSTDTGIANAAGAIDSTLSSVGNQISNTTRDAGNNVAASVAAAANAINQQSAANTANLANAIAHSAGSGTGTDNAGIESRLDTLHSDNTATWGPAQSAVAGGTSAMTTTANSQLSAGQSQVSTALGGAGTMTSNGQFTGTGLGTAATGAANGVLGGTRTDTPLPTISVSATGVTPFTYTFSMGADTKLASLPGDVCTLLAAVSNWGWALWFMFAMQAMATDWVKNTTQTTAQQSANGVENTVLPFSGALKTYAAAAFWVTVVAGLWAGVIATLGTILTNNGITPGNMFSGTAIASALPASLAGATSYFAWMIYAFAIPTALALTASYWVARWTLDAIMLSASALVRAITA